MTYLSGKSKSRGKYLQPVLSVIAFILFIYFWPALRTVAYPLVEPLMRGYKSSKNATGFLPSSFSTYFTSRQTLSARNADLENAVERLENQLAQKDALLRQEADAQAGRVATSSVPVVVLYPIAEDATKLYSTILLSKGYKDGLQKGGLVYVRGQQAACEVVEVYTTTSLCELLSKGGRTTEGVTSLSHITVTLLGQGGGNFTAELPQAANLQVGETVYLRSDPSMLLGTIVSIKTDEQATNSTVYVRGAYNPVTSQVFYINSKYAP